MTMVHRLFTMLVALLPTAGPAQDQARPTGGTHPQVEDLERITYEFHFVKPKGYVQPARADLSDRFPPAGDQYGQASCSGWALGYGLATYHWNHQNERRPDTTFLHDPTQVFSPAFVYSLTANRQKNTDCRSDVVLAHAIEVVCDTGCATWRQFPYDTLTCLRLPPDSAMAGAYRYRMSHPVNINNWDFDQWKYYLSKGQPVIFFVTISPAYFTEGFLTERKAPFTWQETFPVNYANREGHIMVCTGFEGDSTMIALNSWGPRWGERGYVRIPLDMLHAFCSEAFVLSPYGAPRMVAAPAAVKEQDLGKDARTRGGLGRQETHVVDSIAFRVLGPAADGEDQLVEIMDAGSWERVRTLELREDQPLTFHHEGDLYTFTHTGRRWFGGQLRYRLVKNDPAAVKALQERKETIDRHADGVLDGKW